VEFDGLSLLGRYRVEGKVAEGGMGAVYRALDSNLGTPVVVKVPHERLLADDSFRRRFEAEIAELIRLPHRGIVPILARGEHERVPFFVLPWLGGGSLASRLESLPGRRQSPEEVAAWLRTVASTLDFVHARGVVHRDVKPGNILFDEHGECYLSDFGIAKVVAADAPSLTSTGLTVGSPVYMAPEQVTSNDVSPRADQYALASTVYEALCGAPPFEGSNAMEIVVRKQGHDPRPVLERAPNVPAAIGAAVARALSRDPSARFPTCTAFAREVETALERGAAADGVARSASSGSMTALAPAPPPPAAVAAPAAPRGRGRRWILAGVGVAVVGLAWALLFGGGDSRGGATAPATSLQDVLAAVSRLDATLDGLSSLANARHPAIAKRIQEARRTAGGVAAQQARGAYGDAMTLVRQAEGEAAEVVKADRDASEALAVRAEFEKVTLPDAPKDAEARRRAEAARSAASTAAAAGVEGRFEDARTSWLAAREDATQAAALEQAYQDVAGRIAAARSRLGPAPGTSSPAPVVASWRRVSGAMDALQALLDRGEVDRARDGLASLDRDVEAARNEAGKAAAAGESRSRWTPLERRIQAGPLYAKVREALLAAAKEGAAGVAAFTAGSFAEARTTLDGAVATATGLLAEHDAALEAARKARAEQDAPLPATAPAEPAKAWRDALARADAAIAEGRYDDVAAAVADAAAARQRVDGDLRAARDAAEPFVSAWRALAKRAPAKWFDEVEAAARAAIALGREGERAFDAGAFSEGRAKAGKATEDLSPLLQRHDKALAAADAARATWKSSSEKAIAKGHLTPGTRTAGEAAETDYAAGRFVAAERAFLAAAGKADADAAARMQPYTMSGVPGGLPTDWKGDAWVRIESMGLRAKRPNNQRGGGEATSPPLDVFGDFVLRADLLSDEQAHTGVTLALVGTAGTPDLTATASDPGKNGSATLTLSGGGNGTGAGGGSHVLVLTRTGSAVVAEIDGSPGGRVALPPNAAYAAVRVTFRDSHFYVRSLSIEPR
jgi:serine/threonine-protein kinase